MPRARVDTYAVKQECFLPHCSHKFVFIPRTDTFGYTGELHVLCLKKIVISVRQCTMLHSAGGSHWPPHWRGREQSLQLHNHQLQTRAGGHALCKCVHRNVYFAGAVLTMRFCARRLKWNVWLLWTALLLSTFHCLLYNALSCFTLSLPLGRVALYILASPENSELSVLAMYSLLGAFCEKCNKVCCS